MTRARSTAERADASFKELCKARKRWGFIRVHDEGEVTETWHYTYSMPHHEIVRVRQLVQDVRSALGKVPWQYEPDN